MKNKNKIKDELKVLEEKLGKKINQHFYVHVGVFLMLLVAIYFTLSNFAVAINDASKIKPAKAIKIPAIRKA